MYDFFNLSDLKKSYIVLRKSYIIDNAGILEQGRADLLSVFM